jgi:hypothetical protein
MFVTLIRTILKKNSIRTDKLVGTRTRLTCGSGLGQTYYWSASVLAGIGERTALISWRPLDSAAVLPACPPWSSPAAPAIAGGTRQRWPPVAARSPNSGPVPSPFAPQHSRASACIRLLSCAQYHHRAVPIHLRERFTTTKAAWFPNQPLIQRTTPKRVQEFGLSRTTFLYRSTTGLLTFQQQTLRLRLPMTA